MVKNCFLILLVLTGSFCFGQNQQLADSLIVLYNSGAYDMDEFEILEDIASNETKSEVTLEYAELIIYKAAKDSLFDKLFNGYLYKGNAHQAIGQNTLALEAFYQSHKFALRTGDKKLVGSAMISIAGTYANIDNIKNAKQYYKKSIVLMRELHDSIGLASALTNLGDVYITEEELDTALVLTQEASAIFTIKNHTLGRAYSRGNIGMIYATQQNDELAEVYLKGSIKTLEALGDYYPVCVYLTYLSDIYVRKNDLKQALIYAEKSLTLAQENGLVMQIGDANLKLSELLELSGNFKQANLHLKKYYIYRDSILNIEAVRKMADQRTNFEVAQKQIEVGLLKEKQEKQRITLTSSIVAVILISFLAIGLFHRNRYIQKTSNIIEGERDRSDNLLCNILPEKTAKELKEIGKVKAKHFDSVSVMFTDFKAFTANSDKLSPEELVESIDFYFSKFDEIMEKYNLEKIKTIGDAYMCAGGLPHPTVNHAHRMIEAAFEIAAFVSQSKKEDPHNMTRFDIRIGINTGPVVAGVVGSKKFAYDIWGDTVNIASRMESNSEPGKVNISENTYQLVKNEYCCRYRGKIEAKYKGKLKMYFVNGRLDHQDKEMDNQEVSMKSV